VRIVRVRVQGGRVGLAFGDVAAGRCAPSVLRSPGAVVRRSHVEGADVGVAACDAQPVLMDNVLVRNGVGLVLGAPGRAPGDGAHAVWDACACAPTLDGVRATTTLLYSSGCGGCQVHESWLPALRAQGHEIRVRETGRGHEAEGQRFDDFARRCAPELTDVLGIPGCVPNYACLADGAAAKLRRGEGLDLEVHLDSAEDVARFATGCRETAARRFQRGGDCVRHALAGNLVCANRSSDIRAAPGAARLGGEGNACGHVEGWSEGGHEGCERPCPPELPALAPPVVLPAQATAAPVPTTAPEAGSPPVAPTPARTAATPAAPAPDEPAQKLPWLLAGLLVALGAGSAWRVARGRRT
jgi:hypothetical protein